MALFWSRARIESPRPSHEVQARLAAATAAWSGEFRGRSVPLPPWTPEGHFLGSPGGLANVLVVAGEVRPHGDGSMTTALIRPHGVDLTVYALFLAWISGSAFLRGDVVPGLVMLSVFGIVAAAFLWFSAAEKSPAIRDVMSAACGVSGEGLPPGGGERPERQPRPEV